MKWSRQRFVRAAGGWVLLGLAGCGGDGGDGTATLPSGPGCQPITISDNHGHVFEVPEADLDATDDKVYTSVGIADHVHTITLTPTQLSDLKVGKEVAVTSSSASSPTWALHAHAVLLKCL